MAKLSQVKGKKRVVWHKNIVLKKMEHSGHSLYQRNCQFKYLHAGITAVYLKPSSVKKKQFF